MNDEQGFLAAIATGDHTARLVFADWLDERGDPRGP
ncbi:MAG: TIGR02996 domain-containing protein, partial [Gemmata sp.]